MTDEDQPPPQNQEAEQAVLGALLVDPSLAATLADELDGRDFYRPAHETIWDAAQALARDDTGALDPITLADRLTSMGELQRIGGAPYLHTLMQSCPTPGNAPYYAGLVRNAARLRTITDTARRLQQLARTGDPEALDRAFDDAYATLDQAAGRVGPRTGTTRPTGRLELHTIPELRARALERGPRRWLVRGIWPASTYGVHGAEQKAQKTWNAFDLAVSVTSGTPWLGHFPIDDPGPVIIFAGEGGEGEVLRRLDGICAERNLKLDDLAITVCVKAPHLSNADHMAEFARALTKHRPHLVILDPLYLAAKGADLKDLYAMGALLETAQHACAEVEAALWVNHHHNRSRDARGSARMSGAGPAEWGRVLIGGSVITRHTDHDTKETRVLTELEVIGGGIADDKFRVFRRIRAEDPDDLESLLHYTVEVLPGEDTAPTGGDTATGDGSNLTPAQRKLLEAMTAHADPATTKQLVDWIHDKYGHGLTRETVSKSLNTLADRGAADSVEVDEPNGRWAKKLWFIPTPQEATP